MCVGIFLLERRRRGAPAPGKLPPKAKPPSLVTEPACARVFAASGAADGKAALLDTARVAPSAAPFATAAPRAADSGGASVRDVAVQLVGPRQVRRGGCADSPSAVGSSLSPQGYEQVVLAMRLCDVCVCV